jgi:hypothetical protein
MTSSKLLCLNLNLESQIHNQKRKALIEVLQPTESYADAQFHDPSQKYPSQKYKRPIDQLGAIN